ncbi:MAG: peptide chain release factor-like protein [Akkermansiaceae bacterium]|jgi:peptide chain release factor|nr:peptide chain release factor-like protein [Akkermansiaceae bacterium]
MISADKKGALERRMASLGIFEDDLIEKFIRGTGSGGQKVNKTSSCVFLQHPPSRTEIKVQRERSREMNRFLAREELCDRLEERETLKTQTRKQAREKTRRRNRRQGVRARARNVEKKRQHGQKKQNRRRPGIQD